IFTVAFSLDGKKIASAATLGNSLKVWDSANGKELLAIFGDMGVSFSPDGKMIAGVSRGVLKIWDAGTGKELVSLAKEKCGDGVCFSPDGKRLASVQNYTVKVWDVSDLIEKARSN